MKAMYSLLLAAAVGLGGLAACSGGGGNPGTCVGSDEVCGTGQGNSSADGVGSVPPEPAPTPPSSEVTCASFASQIEAQAAFVGGARQLDLDNNGIACDE